MHYHLIHKSQNGEELKRSEPGDYAECFQRLAIAAKEDCHPRHAIKPCDGECK